MNAPVHHRMDLPLAVDLDGTLVSTDMLWETVFLLLKKNPLYLFLLPVWLYSGKARLKWEIAKRVTVDASHLPYRKDFLAFLRREHAAGRQIVLATASAEPIARAVADELKLFSAVYSTSAGNNLSAKRKASALCAAYGEKGFDFAGNDRADIPVFDVARSAIIVAPDVAADRYQKRHGTQRFDSHKASLKTYVKMLRVHQWLKNLLVFAPAVLAHTIAYSETIIASSIAFLAFSFSASAIYILNDIIDLPLDRRHPTKRNRPFASGALSIPFGLTMSACLLLAAASLCLLLPAAFAAVIGIYLIATTAYSLSVKRMLLIDVLCLAGLYSLRLLGGKAATELPLSFWLVAFALFFFLSLALVKRYVELQVATVDERDRIAGRGYRPEDIQVVGQAGVSSAFAAALVLSLYIQSRETAELYTQPWLIWPIVPIVLYIIVRVWILAHRREMHDDPVVFIATDWRSQAFIVLGACLLLVASFI
ncbi:UbiA family prenyltransferase [Shinella sedimenti]|uniref:UbiA family prenyltransferase n=1 Tax=Shinella sedimenti TaxID=2919913 RepID=A0ABT0CPS8_9HYPH|nr:UbiA family prenyltransferase [Shinella sedimenti]MCJ8150623.1 UbiA family prenyltransferase [Shinella sedimenti]